MATDCCTSPLHARTATLRLPGTWPWAPDLAAAFNHLATLTTPA